MPASVKVTTRIDDSGWRRVRSRIALLGAERLRVGVLASAGDHESGIGMAELAAIHEFGTRTIPERSFLRRTFIEREAEIGAQCARLGRAVTLGMSPDQALGLFGAWMVAQVQTRVLQGAHIPPPLAPETIRRKGSDRPLVDTGRLMQSITWELKR